MTTHASTRFISTSAIGENWRDISKKVLEQIEALISDGFKPNIGFLYVTESLSEDAASILTLFRSVTGVEHWSGCAAYGVCASGDAHINVPAISVLIGFIPKEDFKSFQARGNDLKTVHKEMEPWLNLHDPMLVICHVSSSVEENPAHALEDIDTMMGGFLIGGFESSQSQKALFAEEVLGTGLSGFVFSQNVKVSAGVSQGCVPMGPPHEISKAGDHVIGFLDGKTPMDVFSQDLSRHAQKVLGYDPKEKLSQGLMSSDILNLIEGQTHIAFPVQESDQNDYLVRNILAIDPDTGMMAVSDMVEDGKKLLFVHRNDESLRTDLSAALVSLRQRVEKEQGAFTPKAAIYISCIARVHTNFGQGESLTGEMVLVREILGDLPLAGFYANGEIFNSRIYGYTGIVVLFL